MLREEWSGGMFIPRSTIPDLRSQIELGLTIFEIWDLRSEIVGSALHNISVGIVNRHLTKRRDLIFHFFPIPDNYNRCLVSIEIFGSRLLNISGGQIFRYL